MSGAQMDKAAAQQKQQAEAQALREREASTMSSRALRVLGRVQQAWSSTKAVHVSMFWLSCMQWPFHPCMVRFAWNTASTCVQLGLVCMKPARRDDDFGTTSKVL